MSDASLARPSAQPAYTSAQEVAICQISDRLQTAVRNGSEITCTLECVATIAKRAELPLEDLAHLTLAVLPHHLSQRTVLGILAAEYLGDV